MTNGANSLGYYLFTAYPACATAWQGTTGVTINNTLTAAGDTNINITATFCMRIYAGQTTAKPLSYTGSALTVTVRSTSSSGFTWLTTSGAGTATVNPRCYFSTGPSTVTVNYTSFQGTAATGTGSFQMRCTNTTPYSLALDAVSGTALGLNYAVGLGTVGTSSVPSQAGTGVAQSYSVAASIAAGQSGTCAVTAGCSATDTRIVTVTY
jgi:spore coat protein U-like protein